jgi:hypothetical protein
LKRRIPRILPSKRVYTKETAERLAIKAEAVVLNAIIPPFSFVFFAIKAKAVGGATREGVLSSRHWLPEGVVVSGREAVGEVVIGAIRGYMYVLGDVSVGNGHEDIAEVVAEFVVSFAAL